MEKYKQEFMSIEEKLVAELINHYQKSNTDPKFISMNINDADGLIRECLERFLSPLHAENGDYRRIKYRGIRVLRTYDLEQGEIVITK